MYSSKERGIALITTMLVMALMSALLIGFTTVVMSDQRYRFIDRNRGQSFYAAAGGIEKLTADLGNLFFSNVAPTGSQVLALVASTKVPSIEGVKYKASQAASVLATSSLKTGCVSDTVSVPNVIRTIKSVGTNNGYALKFCANPAGDPIPTESTVIKTGPYEGLMAQQTPYQMDVTAVTDSGGETHLVRTMESVAIPVFQFGMFSDVDLSFFAGPTFNFGGRVHTNGNLFLAQGNGATLTLAGKVTAVKEIIRKRLQNNVTIAASPHMGTISMAKAANQFVPLLDDEGSVKDGLGSDPNEPKWHTVSLSTYNTWIRNGRTGAKELKLPLLTVGGSNPDLIRRAPAGEAADNNVLFNERLITKSSIRILLSDTAADITTLPGIDTTRTPVLLDGDWRAAAPANGGAVAYNLGGGVNVSHPPIARSPGLVTAVVVIPNLPAAGTPAGAGQTLPIPGGVPAAWKAPQLRVNKGAVNYEVTCTGKTPTTFTGCTNLPANNHAVLAVAAPIPTVSANAGLAFAPALPSGIVPPDGSANIQVSTQLTANWPKWDQAPAPASGQLITVTSTMAFAPSTFWLDNDLVTCSGYDATNLTGCTLPNPLARNTNHTITTASHSTAGTGTIGGFLKVERQNADTTWTDITMEILNYGIADRNLIDGGVGFVCNDPTPNAILRIQRLRSNKAAACPYPITNAAGLAVPLSTDYEPNVLFDPREGLMRDVPPAGTNVLLGGVMHYINLDVANLTRWFGAVAPYTGALAGTGSTAKKDNGGFTVYFSDRRNNRNAANAETGEYGWEDFVNPNTAGVPDGQLNGGEDVNGSTFVDIYGGIPNYNGVSGNVPPCAAPCVAAPLNAAATPLTPITRGDAVTNRAILFRRALKLTNGSNLRAAASGGITGLTIVSENPVYVQGDWNANAGGAGGFAGAHAATSIIADAVTLLSGAWNDTVSFTQPYSHANRPRSAASWYRMAIIAGKGPAFPKPADVATTDFGTDGGAHNFLRFLEGTGGNPNTVNYRGSIATFFFNRQAVGTYKVGVATYNAPVRAFAFDIEFLQPALLPPNTPVFRDMNAVGFAQEMRPGR